MEIKPVVTKNDLIRCSGYWTRTVAVCAFYIAKYDTHIMNSYIVYPLASLNKRIITTIRLSRLSWKTKTTLAPLASRLTTLVLQYTWNT